MQRKEIYEICTTYEKDSSVQNASLIPHPSKNVATDNAL